MVLTIEECVFLFQYVFQIGQMASEEINDSWFQQDGAVAHIF